MSQEPHRPSPGRIVAIGGGKGGAGKSVLAAALGRALAQRGQRCILVDADFGGSNLHTLCGIPSPRMNLRDFLRRKVATLDGIVLPTSTPGLGLISGADAFFDDANLPYAQKQKLIRHLGLLEADFLLLDLGAGTSFNVVDLFLSAHEGLLVVQPTPTSVENAYQFMRSTFYRQFQAAVRQHALGSTVKGVLVAGRNAGIRSPRDLVERVRNVDPPAGEQLHRSLAALRLGLVVNQVARPEEQELAGQMAAACSDYFGIEVAEMGSLPRDERVLEAVKQRRPVLEAFPRSSFALAVHTLALRLMGQREVPGEIDATG